MRVGAHARAARGAPARAASRAPLAVTRVEARLVAHDRAVRLELAPNAVDLAAELAAVRSECAALAPGARAACVRSARGRVIARREHGAALIFIDLEADSSSRLQIVVQPADLDQACVPLLPLLTRAGSAIGARGEPGRTARGEPSLFARSLDLLALPPQPAAVLKAAQLVACGALGCDDGAAALRCTAEALDRVAHAYSASYEMLATDDDADGGSEPAREARAVAASIGGARAPRLRAHRFAAAELCELSAICAEHAEWDAEPIATIAELDGVDERVLPERGLPPSLPPAERALRLSYLQEKKIPQLRWMLGQVRSRSRCTAQGSGMDGTLGATWQVEELLARRRADGGAARRILDLGCGRADLTLLLAARFPQLELVGVDTNESALADATARATNAGLTNAVFRRADAAALLGGNLGDLGGDIDVIVALHACGGLADAALQLVGAAGASALICTCCFHKNRVLAAKAPPWGISDGARALICRVADSCDAPHLAARARRAASCLRLRALRRELGRSVPHASAELAIRTFPREFSAQNTVLVARVGPRSCVATMAGDDALRDSQPPRVTS